LAELGLLRDYGESKQKTRFALVTSWRKRHAALRALGPQTRHSLMLSKDQVQNAPATRPR
jgi:hypothetical protein